MRRVGHHDVGGDPALATATVPADVPLHAWELEAHALFSCLAKNGHFSTDESRRTIEGFAPTDYLQWGYYEKFSAAAANLLREKGLLANQGVIAAGVAELRCCRNVVEPVLTAVDRSTRCMGSPASAV